MKKNKKNESTELIVTEKKKFLTDRRRDNCEQILWNIGNAVVVTAVSYGVLSGLKSISKGLNNSNK